MARLWAGPWGVGRLGDAGQPAHWEPPAGAIEALDARTAAQCAHVAGIDPADGAGLFETDDATDLGSDYVEVPRTLTVGTRDALEAMLGVTGIRATTADQLVIDLLTVHADPDGVTAVPPLMPDHTGRLVLHFAGIPFDVGVDPSSPYWPKVQAVLQRTYRDLRAESLGGYILNRDPLFHRRMLTVWLEQFGQTDARLFIPADLPFETPLPHHTSIGDNFNVPDNVILLGQLPWGYTGNWSIVSNHGSVNAVEVEARAEVDLSSGDQAVQVTAFVNTANSYLGACARFSAAAYTCYGYFSGDPAVAPSRLLIKVVAGSRTNFTGDAVAGSTNDILKITANGSTLTGFTNGVVVSGPLTDTVITSGVRAGIFGYAANSQFDDFLAADLAGAIATLRRVRGPMGQAVNRASTY